MDELKKLSTYIRLFDGYGKPKINFQDLYKLFPRLKFIPSEDFGQYRNFGEAFESKNLSMTVTDKQGHTSYLTYREYVDANENLAYVEQGGMH